MVCSLQLFSRALVSVVTSMMSGTLRLSVPSSLCYSAHFHIPPTEGGALFVTQAGIWLNGKEVS